MMISEFIERTGFEPTAEEYKKIEADYIEMDVEKDGFCKMWKRKEMQKVVRARAKKIEKLENDLKEQEIEKGILIERLNNIKNRTIKSFNEKIEDLNQRIVAETARADEAEKKLQILMEAAKILKLA